MSPTLSDLLKDAALAAARGKPLYYCKTGFRDMRRNTVVIHSFLTVRAAERRGLVITTGEAPHRLLHITGRGLDVAGSLRRLSRPGAVTGAAPSAGAATPIL